MTPLPSPTMTKPPTKARDIVGPLLHGLWHGVTASAWTILLATVVVLVITGRLFRFVRWLPLTSANPDSRRRFLGADRAAIIHRAGGRCEFHGLVGGRCRKTENLHADHIHPHSRGGSTTVDNGQALCSGHNKQKGARIPFQWELWLIEKRRLRYFPVNERTAILRRECRVAADARDTDGGQDDQVLLDYPVGTIARTGRRYARRR